MCLSSALLNAKTAFRRQNQKDRDSRVDCLLETGCLNNNEEGPTKVLEGEEKSVVCNKGLRDALLRGPKAFVLCKRKPLYSVLWFVLGVVRAQVRMERWIGCQHTVCETTATVIWSASLLSLIEIPLLCRPHGRRKGGARS